MARISGVDLPGNKRVEIGLTSIFGIGRVSAQQIVDKLKIAPGTRIKDLKEEEVAKIREELEKSYKVEGELRKEEAMAIRRLMEIGSYRGMRHKKGLPVRGQRTKTNAKTRRKLAGKQLAGAKKAAAAAKE